MALEMVNVVGFTSCSGYTPPALNTRAYNNYQFFTYGTDLLASAGGTYYVNTDTLKIFRRADNDSFLRVLGVNGTNIGDVLITGNAFYGLAFAIDRTTQRGTIYCCYEQTGGFYKWQWDAQQNANYYNSNAVYNAILGAIQPTYNWQSVPSISGKNGILQFMSTIVDMNDGDPITTADTTKFTLVEESNVGVITEDIDDSIKPGAEAGGISGSGSNSADQSTGNAFGLGESGTNLSGGGSGLYGGYKGTSSKSGGAGSGYIGNSLLSNKKMVGYNVPTSSAEGTKTESVNEVSASAVSGKPKSGNGFARIKFLREVAQFRSIGLPLANRIVPAKFKPEYAYYYGEQEVPKGEQYYDIEGATAITIQRGGGDSFTFGDLPACFGIYDPNSSNVVNWYLRKVNSSGATMLVDSSNTGSFSPDGNYTFYVIAGGEPENPNGKGYFTIIRTTDWSNGWGGLAFSTDVMAQLRNYFTWG